LTPSHSTLARHRGLLAGIALSALLLEAGCEPGEQAPGSTALHAAAERTSTKPETKSKPESATEPETPVRPNLVLITLDTLRADALGAYGQRANTTPNIDRLASQGVLFERVSSSNPETLPSHATLFTGRWPYTHGVRANAGYVLAERNLTLAEQLASQGYATAAEVATRVLRNTTGVTQGFERYRGPDSPGVKHKRIPDPDDPENPHVTDTRVGSDISARGIEFIRKNRRRPFFLWLHYFDAHQPHAPAATFRRRIPSSPYHAEVASLDYQVGLVIGELERLGLAGRTLVAVTADHGEGLGEHGEDSHAYLVYDTTMQVPLVLWGLKDLPRGRRISTPVRTVDLAPTALDLMAQPALPDAQGVSLAPLIRGKASDLQLVGYGEAHQLRIVFGLPVLRFIEVGRWKYIHKVSPELYDIERDPGERTNLASEHPDVVVRLRAQLAERLRAAPSVPDDARVAVDAELAQELSALGYVTNASEPGDVTPGESLVLSGDDPMSRLADIKALANAGQHLTEGDDQSEASLEVLAEMYERGELDAAHMNNYAWALATSEDERLRDGPKAVEVMARALFLGGAPNPGYLDTLAAAQAASGQFEAAARTGKEALHLAESMGSDVAIMDQLRGHLASFEAGEAL
jgi:arylsulfatase A-like enzyme